jgi:hypothetical protein
VVAEASEGLRSLGVSIDWRTWTVEDLDVVTAVIAAGETKAADRLALVTDLVGSWAGSDELQTIVDLAAPPTDVGQWQVEDLDDVQLARLKILLEAIDGDVLALGFGEHDGNPFLAPTAAVEVRLLRAHGNKSGLLAAAKALADRLGVPRPTSSAKAMADPLLVAHLAAEANTNP